MPKYSIAQLNFHQKQESKILLGKISDKHQNKNPLRVDNIAFTLGFAKTIYHAKRLLNSRNIKINKKKSKNESQLIKSGTLLQFR